MGLRRLFLLLEEGAGQCVPADTPASNCRVCSVKLLEIEASDWGFLKCAGNTTSDQIAVYSTASPSNIARRNLDERRRQDHLF
eukprot:4448742-Amphidinium_carterae.1